MSKRTEMTRLVAAYRRAGWVVEPTGGGHLKWLPPGGGQPVFSSASPGDYRSIRNTIAQLKRALTHPRVPSYN